MCSVFKLPFVQVYYELDEERKKTERSDVAICRVEQLCPFPYDLIQRELKRYPSMNAFPQVFRFCFVLWWIMIIPFGATASRHFGVRQTVFLLVYVAHYSITECCKERTIGRDMAVRQHISSNLGLIYKTN